MKFFGATGSAAIYRAMVLLLLVLATLMLALILKGQNDEKDQHPRGAHRGAVLAQ